MVGVATGLTFLAVMLLGLGVALWERTQQSPERLVRQRLTGVRTATVTGPKTTIGLFRDEAMSGLPVLHRWLSRIASASTFRKYLEQAEVSERVGMVLGLTGLLGLIGGRVVWSLTTSWAWAAIAVVGCGSLPVLYVRRQRRLRLGRYAEQLADALDLLTRSLRAGQSFMQGLQTVAGEMPDPTATEFRMTFEALRLGRSLREALQAHADRVDNLDFNLLATALLIQREVGGNLTEILEHASETIRERYKLLGQIRALSAQNRLAGQIIGVLPLAIGVMIYLLQPDLILVLFKEETGRLLLAMAFVMQILGFYAMKRITTIKI